MIQQKPILYSLQNDISYVIKHLSGQSASKKILFEIWRALFDKFPEHKTNL